MIILVQTKVKFSFHSPAIIYHILRNTQGSPVYTGLPCVFNFPFYNAKTFDRKPEGGVLRTKLANLRLSDLALLTHSNQLFWMIFYINKDVYVVFYNKIESYILIHTGLPDIF